MVLPMKFREGFVSNSSSASFLIRMDGLKGKQITIEDLKVYFPPSKLAMNHLSLNALEDIYISLWRVITAKKEGQYEALSEVYPPKGWKSARMVTVGNDPFYEKGPFSWEASSRMFVYGESLFDSKNIIQLGEDDHVEEKEWSNKEVQ